MLLTKVKTPSALKKAFDLATISSAVPGRSGVSLLGGWEMLDDRRKGWGFGDDGSDFGGPGAGWLSGWGSANPSRGTARHCVMRVSVAAPTQRI